MKALTKISNQSVLNAEWITPEEWHSNLNDPVKSVSYGQSKSGAHEWQGKKTKWHEKSFSVIARRYSQQADAVEAGRDPEMDDELFLAV